MNGSQLTAGTSAPITHRRTIHYVDQKIQATALILLVVLEICLVGGALWVLYGDLNAIIDAQMFRVHQPKVSDTTPILFSQLWRAILWMIGINVLVLIVADRVWAHYIKTITRVFRDVMNKIIALDFVPAKTPVSWHHVLDLAAHWRSRERSRCHGIRSTTEALSKAVAANNWGAARAATLALRTLASGAVSDPTPQAD